MFGDRSAQSQVFKKGGDTLFLEFCGQFAIHFGAIIAKFAADFGNLLNPMAPALNRLFSQYFKGHCRAVFPILGIAPVQVYGLGGQIESSASCVVILALVEDIEA